MYEKVNPSHPDKLADRIAGALVDLAYKRQDNPRVAVEVMLGHGKCVIIAETSVSFSLADANPIVERIVREAVDVELVCVPQDAHLSSNQRNAIRCGDNGIFKGVPVTGEQTRLADIARKIYVRFPTDGKYILDDRTAKLVICQSNATRQELTALYPGAVVNPIGDWTGGPGVDAGATNRKLGSDMGDGVTGGGLHGKDLSKADVSVNIYAHLEAQRLNRPVLLSCAIGDEAVDGVPYAQIVKTARAYIEAIGGFEKFAEWGLI